MENTGMRIALLGTRGVPARYGGFETAVEEIGQRLVTRGHKVSVYCRPTKNPKREYEGMELVHLPAIPMRSLETLSHTSLSAVHVRGRHTDVAIVFNAANFPLLPVLRSKGIPVAMHVDGLEWQRSKWGPLAQRYYRLAERMAVRWADELIADAEGIRTYYRDRYRAHAHLLSYGAPILSDAGSDRLSTKEVESRGYHLVVARFEPENQLHVIVEGFHRSGAKLPLLVVGSSPYNAPYARQLRQLADSRVRFLGPVWDQELLNQLYANAATYVHGHSVGGTNPSLLRAMGAAAPVIAYDVVFNREVAGGSGVYFDGPTSFAGLVEEAEHDPEGTRRRGYLGQQRVAQRYRWEDVAAGYEALCRTLADGKRSPAVMAP